MTDAALSHIEALQKSIADINVSLNKARRDYLHDFYERDAEFKNAFNEFVVLHANGTNLPSEPENETDRMRMATEVWLDFFAGGVEVRSHGSEGLAFDLIAKRHWGVVFDAMNKTIFGMCA